jgi:protein lifeguard
MSYNYGLEEGLYNNKGVFDDMSIRKGFIRKVYSLLSIQLIFTTALTSLFVLNDNVKSFGQSDTGQGLLILSIVTMLATLIGPLCCCMDAYKKYPQIMQYYLFLLCQHHIWLRLEQVVIHRIQFCMLL